MATQYISSLRYHVVYDVKDAAGNIIADGMGVLPDGVTPPAMNVGDPWRWEMPDGSFIETTVEVLNRLLIVGSGHMQIQLKFSLKAA